MRSYSQANGLARLGGLQVCPRSAPAWPSPGPAAAAAAVAAEPPRVGTTGVGGRRPDPCAAHAMPSWAHSRLTRYIPAGAGDLVHTSTRRTHIQRAALQQLENFTMHTHCTLDTSPHFQLSTPWGAITRKPGARCARDGPVVVRPTKKRTGCRL